MALGTHKNQLRPFWYHEPMADIRKLTDLVVAFRDARDWKQFHNPKDMAISLALEAGEVLEHFQWKSDTEIQSHIESKREELGDELADVLYWVLLMANDTDVDIAAAFERKLAKNGEKYPVEKSQGKHTKYTEL